MGDTRAAIVPFLAHKQLGDTYKWLLYGDDDTVWFMDGVLDVLSDLDPDTPYFISGQHSVIDSSCGLASLACSNQQYVSATLLCVQPCVQPCAELFLAACPKVMQHQNSRKCKWPAMLPQTVFSIKTLHLRASHLEQSLTACQTCRSPLVEWGAGQGKPSQQGRTEVPAVQLS